VLATLSGHPATAATKLQAYAILNGLVALITGNELTGLSRRQTEPAGYLERVAREGRHPHLAAAMADGRHPLDFDDVVARVATGLLGS
jgi:tRNA C32,U32 (ribose-2'-O)-methylase TrmJ